MDIVKEKIDKWSSGWRLMTGIITPIVVVVVWSLTQIYTIKLDMKDLNNTESTKQTAALHKLEVNIINKITEVRNEITENNNTYHARVDIIEERVNDIKVRVTKHQEPTNRLHKYD